MSDRTEEQILARAPIGLQFGGKKYEAPILTILKARKWRETLINDAKEIAGSLTSETNGRDESFFVGLGTVFLGFPEKMADLVFAYAPDSRKKKLEQATEEELGVAFAAIMKVAFPFSRQLSLMTSIFQMGASLPSASEKSTKSPSPSGDSSQIH
jgi:hypothetical protein